MRDTLILGAGMAGLGAADRLKQFGGSYKLIERQDGPGGLVRTDQVGNFFFDRAGHFIHTRSRDFADRLRGTGIEFRELVRRSAVLLDDHVIPYPIQFNLWAAPAAMAEAVRAELESLPPSLPPDLPFDDLLVRMWGATLTDRFFRPYLEKMWRLPLHELPADWAADFAPRRQLDLMVKGLRTPNLSHGYNATFHYPASGRLGELAAALAAAHRERLHLHSEVANIDLSARSITLSDGRQLPFETLINTLPLPTFLKLVGRAVDTALFAHSNLINLRVGFRGSMLRQEHWYYVPDRSVPFFRVGFPSNLGDGIAPPDCCSLSLEYGTGSETRLPADPHELAVEALEFLAGRGILEWSSIEVVDVHLIAPAYVARRMTTTPSLQRLAAELQDGGVYVAGRYGGWDYLSLEEAWLTGAQAATLAWKSA